MKHISELTAVLVAVAALAVALSSCMPTTDLLMSQNSFSTDCSFNFGNCSSNVYAKLES